MIDLHTHILPGIDDGAKTLEIAVEMARIAVADGTTVMACTPHIYPGLYMNDSAGIHDERDKLQKANKDASSVIQKISNRAPHIDDVRHDFLMLEQEINTIKEYIVWFRSQ